MAALAAFALAGCGGDTSPPGDGPGLGPRPASSAGVFRDTGGGPLAVESTNTHLYAAQRLRLVRWNRSRFMNWKDRGDVYEGRTLAVRSTGGGRLLGVAVCNSEA